VPITQKKFYNWLGRTFEVQEGKAVECTDCSMTWCMHVEEALIAQADTEDLFSDQHRLTTNFPVIVPIFPTKDIFTMVYLENISEYPIKAYHVVFTGEQRGVIGEGEGRLSIREMLLSYNEVATEVPVCQSHGHSFKQEMQFQRNWKDRKMRVIEKWLLATTNTCLTCTRPGVSDDDFDDLVPASETSWK
jgi:hypothetical protein